ncbi:unnamed protein product [Linum trigynum]|uniref:Uncharacterized protein n=1 Tax=Linum trigynum TaxID=586398 RepID=A0AAV2ENE5_9ROSI
MAHIRWTQNVSKVSALPVCRTAGPFLQFSSAFSFDEGSVCASASSTKSGDLQKATAPSPADEENQEGGIKERPGWRLGDGPSRSFSAPFVENRLSGEIPQISPQSTAIRKFERLTSTT